MTATAKKPTCLKIDGQEIFLRAPTIGDRIFVMQSEAEAPDPMTIMTRAYLRLCCDIEGERVYGDEDIEAVHNLPLALFSSALMDAITELLFPVEMSAQKKS